MYSDTVYIKNAAGAQKMIGKSNENNNARLRYKTGGNQNVPCSD